MQAVIFMWTKLGAVAWKRGPKLSQRLVTMTWKSLELSFMGRQGEVWSVEQGLWGNNSEGADSSVAIPLSGVK